MDPNPSTPSENYAPVNQGQLKNVATKAALYLNNILPSPGVGGTINAMVDPVTGFQHTADDYSPINLGQLKAVAKPFYDRLIQVGYGTKLNLANHGVPGWTFDYPWDPATPAVDNYAPANLGQLKWVFSFDLAQDGPDALPDWWERLHFSGTTGNDPDADADGDGLTNLQEFQQRSDPNDFWNGQPPVFTQVAGDNQSGQPGSLLSVPLTVQIQNAQHTPFAGGAVSFVITQGGGTLQTTSSSTPAASCTKPSDSQGQVKVYMRLPSGGSSTSQITATFSGQTVVFAANANSQITAPGYSPYSPLNLHGVLNSDGSQDLTWDNNPDSSDPVPIWLMNDDGSWRQIGTAPLGATSYHIPPQ